MVLLFYSSSQGSPADSPVHASLVQQIQSPKLTPCVSSKKLSRSTWLRISEPRASPQIVNGARLSPLPTVKNQTHSNCAYIQLRCEPTFVVWCMYLHTREHDALLQPALPTILHRPTAPNMRRTEEGPSC